MHLAVLEEPNSRQGQSKQTASLPLDHDVHRRNHLGAAVDVEIPVDAICFLQSSCPNGTTRLKELDNSLRLGKSPPESERPPSKKCREVKH